MFSEAQFEAVSAAVTPVKSLLQRLLSPKLLQVLLPLGPLSASSPGEGYSCWQSYW